jgi:hypothetical protein
MTRAHSPGARAATGGSTTQRARPRTSVLTGCSTPVRAGAIARLRAGRDRDKMIGSAAGDFISGRRAECRAQGLRALLCASTRDDAVSERVDVDSRPSRSGSGRSMVRPQSVRPYGARLGAGRRPRNHRARCVGSSAAATTDAPVWHWRHRLGGGQREQDVGAALPRPVSARRNTSTGAFTLASSVQGAPGDRGLVCFPPARRSAARSISDVVTFFHELATSCTTCRHTRWRLRRPHRMGLSRLPRRC